VSTTNTTTRFTTPSAEQRIDPEDATGSAVRTCTDSSTGWTICTLRAVLDRRQGGGHRSVLEVRICPEAGNNAFSFQIDGRELLVPPPALSDLPGYTFGVPLLYPTPNRVRGSTFTFEGRTFSFPPNDGPNFLHGLVHSIPWEHSSPIVRGDSAELTTWLDVRSGHSLYERFPIHHRVRITFTLSPRGLRYDLSIENLDRARLPFGFGIHPYFAILGERESTRVCIPAAAHMRTTSDLLPTGAVEPLEHTSFDLREPVSLARLDLDDVFSGLSEHRPAFYDDLRFGLKMVLRASPIFTHAVLFCPKGRSFFCLENQTCSTDAHNLYARGLARESHLLVVEPSETTTGWVELEPSLVASPSPPPGPPFVTSMIQ